MRKNDLQAMLKIPRFTPLAPRQWALFFLLLALGLTLRRIDLDKYPHKYQTLDEYHYLWAGMSLIHDGRPTAWSILQNYWKIPGVHPRMISHGDIRAPMVTPALDHPPLFSITAGAFGLLMGGHPVMRAQSTGPPFEIWRINLLRARHLSLLLFVATFYLLFQIALAEFSFGVACLASLFYAVITHIVFHNRLIVTENLTTPLLLLNIYFLQRYVAQRSSRAVFGAITIVSVAVALLCKLVAVSQAAAILYLLFLYDRRRDVLFPIAGALIGAAIYLAYGWWQDWHVFVTILVNQAERFDGFATTQRFLTMPEMVHTNNMHYLLLISWICLFIQMISRKGCTILAAAPAYLLAFTFFAAVPAIYGWHGIPFYPFLCLALAVTIRDAYRRTEPVEVIVLFLLLVSALLQSLRPLVLNDLLLWRIWLVAILGVAASLLFRRNLRRKFLRGSLIVIVAIAAYMEVWGVLTHEIWREKPTSRNRALLRKDRAEATRGLMLLTRQKPIISKSEIHMPEVKDASSTR